MHRSFRAAALLPTIALLLSAQQAAPPGAAPAKPTAPAPAQPAAGKPAPAPAQPAPAQPAPAADAGGFLLDNVSLLDFIDILAKRMKINYILDPRFKGGSVTVHTYGQVHTTDLMPLLQTVLRINGAAIVQVGQLYRIVPVGAVSELPISPDVNATQFADDERMVLNLIFLKYATAPEIAKLVQPFLGEGAKLSTYDPANLVLLLDNSRNMKRTMELIALFDSDTFAGKRVRLFGVSNGRPSDIVKELDAVFKAFAMSEKNSAVKFLPVDRINTILAVAPNPGIFTEVENWIKKLDVPVKVTAGSKANYVYRLKYQCAETVASALMSLYMGMPMMGPMGMGMGGGYGMGGYGMGGCGMSGMGGMAGPAGAFNQSGLPVNGYGMGGYGGYGMGGYGMGGYGMGGYGMGGYGMSPYGMGGYGMSPYGMNPYGAAGNPMAPNATAPGTAASGTSTATGDLTGSYLGAAAYPGMLPPNMPHIVPNPFDNTLLIQATPQQWEQISSTLRQLDVAPRQVLIEAKIYEVDLTGQFQGGVESYLAQRGATISAGGTTDKTGNVTGATTLSRQLLGQVGAGGLNLTAGMLVGHSRQLLALLTAQEATSRARVISAPKVIATDSVPASINVGESVPTLTSQALAGGVNVGGTSPFTNTISNTSTGVALNIVARVNSSGIVTLMINQNVSAPVPTTTSAINSPSFSQRNVQTQVTVQDGDTVAIGGIMQESDTLSSSGIPFLHRIPILGMAFGSKSSNKQRTELIVFLTPRVIYDTNQISDATDDLASQLKKLRRMMREQ